MKVLVAYKESNLGMDILKLAAQRIKASTGEVFVITSLLGGEHTDNNQAFEAEQALRVAESYLKEHGVGCHVRLLVRGNSPGEDIVQFAVENDIDEIIIGVRNRSKVGKLLFGSTAQYVILKAECPVTSVK